MRNSKFLCLVFASIQLLGLTKQHVLDFYDPYLIEVSDRLNSTITPLSAQQRFANLGLTMWVYQSGVSAGTVSAFTTEYNNLVQFIKANNITKIIYYPEYSSSTTFFDPASTDADSLVQLMQSNPIPATCAVEFQFDKAPNFSGYTSPNAYVSPTEVDTTDFSGANAVTTGTASYFADIKKKLDWSLDMVAALASSQPFTVTGITIDPEGSGLSGPGVVNTAYQKIANYIDSYLIANNKFGELTNNMTFGINAVTISFGDRSTLPLSSAEDLGEAITNGLITSFPLNAQPPWRTSSQTTPILDNIYIQAYQPSIPYIFTPSLNGLASTASTAGSTAATRMLQLLTDTPYVQGVGTVNISNNDSDKAEITAVSGSGIDFTNAAYTAVAVATNLSGTGFTTGPVIQFSPIAVISNGAQTCVIPDNSQPSDDITCAGKLTATATLATTITLQSPVPNPPSSYSNVPWLFNEILCNWRNFEITQTMANGITFLFSGEYYHPSTFFGQWPLGSFVDFCEAFQAGGSTFGVFKSSSSSKLPIGPNLGVYSYDIINGSFQPNNTNVPANPPQRYVWFNATGEPTENGGAVPY